MSDKESPLLNLSERGRKKNGETIFSDKRLFMQLLAFGNCYDARALVEAIERSGMDGVIYADINDPSGIGVLSLSAHPDFFIDELRKFTNESPFAKLDFKPEFTMLGRTYSLGYEDDLEKILRTEPRRRVLDPELAWAIWYPLRRNKAFEALSENEQRAVLGEHGKLGFKFGHAGYAKDIRLACHGLDKHDNDFVIGVLGKELFPLSSLIQAMRKTKQTSRYIESMGPFFVGKVIWQSGV